MWAALLLALLMLVPAGIAEGAAAAQKGHPYRTRWKHATVGKGALGRVAAGAGYRNYVRRRGSMAAAPPVSANAWAPGLRPTR